MMSLTVPWDHARTFLAVFEEGSLSAAARALQLAQPTVRGHITALESALGTVLFTRSASGLFPTEAARDLVPYARSMFLACESLIRAASASHGRIGGSVRLSVSELIGIEVIPRVLTRLRDLHPDLVVELSLSNLSVDLIGQEADVAVRMTEPKQGAIIARKVKAIPLGFYASRSYLEARSLPQTPEDLLSLDVIGPDRSTEDFDLVTKLVPRLRRESLALRTDSHPAQLAAARAGLGVAVVQVPVGDADPVLMRILPDVHVGRLDIWITMHEDLRSLPRVRTLFDHLVGSFA